MESGVKDIIIVTCIKLLTLIQCIKTYMKPTHHALYQSNIRWSTLHINWRKYYSNALKILSAVDVQRYLLQSKCLSPPKFIWRIPTAQREATRRQGVCDVIGPWVLRIRIAGPMQRPHSTPSPLPSCENTARPTVCHPGEGLLQNTTMWCHDLGLPASRTLSDTCSQEVTGLWYCSSSPKGEDIVADSPSLTQRNRKASCFGSKEEPRNQVLWNSRRREDRGGLVSPFAWRPLGQISLGLRVPFHVTTRSCISRGSLCFSVSKSPGLGTLPFESVPEFWKPFTLSFEIHRSSVFWIDL